VSGIWVGTSVGIGVAVGPEQPMIAQAIEIMITMVVMIVFFFIMSLSSWFVYQIRLFEPISMEDCEYLHPENNETQTVRNLQNHCHCEDAFPKQSPHSRGGDCRTPLCSVRNDLDKG
jgi:hypothetical protein